jgi:hypothetical protein
LSDFVVIPVVCPSKELVSILVMSAANSSNGRAVGTAFDKLGFLELIECIGSFVEELTAETWLIERRRSNKQWPSVLGLSNTVGLVLSSSNEMDPIIFFK